MKKLAAILITLILLGVLPACQATATPAPPPPTATSTRTPIPAIPTATATITPIPALNSLNNPPLLSFKMFAPADGWGLVANQLLLTHNGGQNWFSVPLPGGQVDQNTSAFFRDTRTLLVLLPAADSQSGQLYSSINGGGTWQITAVPFGHGQLTYSDGVAYFLQTRQTGANSMLSSFYRSNDGGLTWNKILTGSSGETGNNSLPEAGLKTGLSLISSEIGWLGMAAQPGKVLLYKTQNGGQVWTAQDLQAPQNISSLTTNSLPPVFFPGDNKSGLLPVDFISQATGDKNRVFYTTTDSGINWWPGGSVIDGGAFTFVDPKNGWVWGKHGLYFTNDAAQTWQLLPVAFGRSEQATMISFVDTRNGWIVTADAKNRVRLYNTTDGGHTWIAINP